MTDDFQKGSLVFFNGSAYQLIDFVDEVKADNIYYSRWFAIKDPDLTEILVVGPVELIALPVPLPANEFDLTPEFVAK